MKTINTNQTVRDIARGRRFEEDERLDFETQTPSFIEADLNEFDNNDFDAEILGFSGNPYDEFS